MEDFDFDLTINGAFDMVQHAHNSGIIDDAAVEGFDRVFTGCVNSYTRENGYQPHTFKEMLRYISNSIGRQVGESFSDKIISYANTFAVVTQNGVYTLSKVIGVDIINELYDNGTWSEQQDLISRLYDFEKKKLWRTGLRATKYLEKSGILPETSLDLSAIPETYNSHQKPEEKNEYDEYFM